LAIVPKIAISTHNLWGYWTECNQIYTQCTYIIAIWYSQIGIAILQFISEHKCDEWRCGRQFYPKIGCYGNVPRAIGKRWPDR